MADESLAELRVTDLLDQLAAATPTPGGGSVAALSGALAAALGQMVCGYTLGKKKYAAAEPRVRELADRLSRARSLLTRLIAEDATAYGELSAAFQLAKDDPERPRRVQQAAVLAAQVPLETASLAHRVAADIDELGRIGNRNLAADVSAAGSLAAAARAAAGANVRANLPLLPEEIARTFAGQLRELGETE